VSSSSSLLLVLLLEGRKEQVASSVLGMNAIIVIIVSTGHAAVVDACLRIVRFRKSSLSCVQVASIDLEERK
jgi:hypothetical protein